MRRLVAVVAATFAVACHRPAEPERAARVAGSHEANSRAAVAPATASPDGAPQTVPVVEQRGVEGTAFGDEARPMTFEEQEKRFYPENDAMGDRAGRFAFVPTLPELGGRPTTEVTQVLLCPPASAAESVLRERCKPIDRLPAGTSVFGALAFPRDRAFVLVLEQTARFYGPHGEPRGRPWAFGERFHTWDVHFTPGGRLLAHWGAGTCVNVSALYDAFGRLLPCAADGIMAPDGHRLLATDAYWSCCTEGAAMWLVDLDTCRTGRTVELSEAECLEHPTPAFDRDGATVRFATTRVVRLDMRARGPGHVPRVPVPPG